jgi:anti-anti-sigma factor
MLRADTSPALAPPDAEHQVELWVSAYLDDPDAPTASDRLDLCLENLMGSPGRRPPAPRKEASPKPSRSEWARFDVWRRKGGITLARLADRELLREDRIEELAADLFDLIDVGNHRLVLDFSPVERLASWAVGLVAEAKLRCEAAPGGALKVCGMRPAVAHLFALAGLLPGLATAPGAAEALAGPWPDFPGPRLPIDILSALRPPTPPDRPGDLPPSTPGAAPMTTLLALVDDNGLAVPVRGPRFEIGRSPDCALRPAAPTVSRRHASIEHRPDGPWLVDLGGANGTLLNGRLLRGEAAPLAHGDLLQVGPLRLAVQFREPSATGAGSVDDLVAGWLVGPSSPPMASTTDEYPLDIPADEPTAAPSIRCKAAGDAWVVAPAGPVDDDESLAELREALGSILGRPGPHQIVVDLEFAGRLNGTAIGVLIAQHLRACRAGGAVRLCQAHPRVRALLDHLQLTRLLGYFDTLDQAVLEPWPAADPAPMAETL